MPSNTNKERSVGTIKQANIHHADFRRQYSRPSAQRVRYNAYSLRLLCNVICLLLTLMCTQQAGPESKPPIKMLLQFYNPLFRPYFSVLQTFYKLTYLLFIEFQFVKEAHEYC